MKIKDYLLVFLLQLMSLSTMAYDVEIDGFYYLLNAKTKTATVTNKSWTGHTYSGTITIPETIKYDGDRYNVTTIGKSAFLYCEYLTNVVIPNCITTIDDDAFAFCNNLKSIFIPSSVIKIGSSFYGCSSLSSIEVDKDNPVYDSRNNCNAIIHTADNALVSGCKNTIIPLDITCINNYAFYGCTGLLSIDIPESVTSIGYRAFYNTNLISLVIPSGVNKIGSYLVTSSSRWAPISVCCYRKEPSQLYNPIYYNQNHDINVGGDKEYTRIRVPAESISAYKSADGWNLYNNIISLDAYDPLEEIADSLATRVLLINIIEKQQFKAMGGNFEALSNSVYPALRNYQTWLTGEIITRDIANNNVWFPDSIWNRILEVAGNLDEYSEEKALKMNLKGNCDSLKEYIESTFDILKHNFKDILNLHERIVNAYHTELEEFGVKRSELLNEISFIFEQLGNCSLPDEAIDNIQALLRLQQNNISVLDMLCEKSHNSLNYYWQNSCDYIDSSLELINTSQDQTLQQQGILELEKYIDNINEALDSTNSYINDFNQLIQSTKDILTNIQSQIKQSNWVLLTVTDENGNDITKRVGIEWYDETGKIIGENNTLGVPDSTTVYYSITLEEELGRIYHEVKSKKVVVDEDAICCQLQRIGKITLNGRVSAIDIDKYVASVSVKQMLNGKYEEMFETKTDEKGEFSISVFDDETDIVVSREDCKDAILHRDGFDGTGNVGIISLNLMPEYIMADIVYRNAVPTGEEGQETKWDGGLNDIEFTLTNKSKRTVITDYTFHNGFLIIKTGAGVGDVIQLVATSKQGVFADSSTTFTITEGRNSFQLALSELGGFDARYLASGNISNAGYLYDNDGYLVARASYIGQVFNLRHLKSGNYTLISMGKSPILSNITWKSDLTAIGLSEGTDYIATSVQVRDGELADLEVSDIPQLNEASFKYTNSRTYFSADKSIGLIGNPVTLSTHIDFNNSLIDKIEQITLLIELPVGCQLVENSVIANRQNIAYELNENCLIMQLNKDQYQKQIRFCVIPTYPQVYSFTAIASFNIDGLRQQPIGSVQYEAKSMTMSVPEETDTTTITFNGIAKGKSEIRIFDNDVLIGSTTAKADGSWTVIGELYKPYNHSFHNIYAKIVTTDGLELTSETKLIEYKRVDIVPKMVTMLYYNQEFDIDYHIEYDLINGTTNPLWYYYFPYKYWPNWWETYETEPKDFTFVAEFTNNDSTQIKNVCIKVLNSDGTIRTLPATYDDKQKAWVATTKYDNSYKLPRNATVEYEYLPHYETEFDPSRVNDDNNQFINLIKNYITNVDTTKVEILDANESMMVCKYQTYTMDNPVYIRIANLDYDDWIVELESQDFFIVDNNGKMIFVRDSIINNRHINWIWTKEDKNLLKLELSNENDFDETTSYNNRKRKAPPATIIGGALDGTLTYFGIRDIINEYNQGYTNLQHWLSQYKNTTDNYFKLYNKTKQLLEAKCSDGTLRLSKQNYEWYSMYLGFYFNDANSMRDAFSMRLGWMERDLVERRNTAVALNASLSILSLIAPGRGLGAVAADRFGTAVINRFGGSIRGWLLESLGDVIDSGIWNMAGTALNWLVDSWYTSDQLNAWYYPENKKIIQNYSDLQKHIRKSYMKCSTDEMDDGDWQDRLYEQNEEYYDHTNENRPSFPSMGTRELNDPSGYVYEAVTSNRLENVKVTCYQKIQNEETVVWNAEDYSQENPLITDSVGFYRWDVPQGMWQVKYEKEGYETTYSDWLPVPPPQLDVNIGMKQSTPPAVKQMRGYESGITIELSKYMQPETMTVENITVTRNGSKEMGNIELVNEEKAPLGEETFVSKVKFVPEKRFNTSDNVVVTVHKEVESYCSVQMTADHVEVVKIEPEVKSIEVDSILTVYYQGEKELRVQVLPKEASAGKTLRVKTSSGMIASVSATEITINKDGVATLTLGGELPGGAVLDFSVDGTDVSATSKVKVIIREMVEAPIASIISGEVFIGTQIELSCETEDVTIYYTLDGSCPCENSPSRKVYDGTPIVINENTIIKAMAVTSDGSESDVAEYTYTIIGDEDAITNAPSTITNGKYEFDTSGRKVGHKAKGVIIQKNDGTSRKVLVK